MLQNGAPFHVCSAPPRLHPHPTPPHSLPLPSVWPNVVVLNTVLSACAKCGQIDRATELLQEMQVRPAGGVTSTHRVGCDGVGRVVKASGVSSSWADSCAPRQRQGGMPCGVHATRLSRPLSLMLSLCRCLSLTRYLVVYVSVCLSLCLTLSIFLYLYLSLFRCLYTSKYSSISLSLYAYMLTL